MSKPGSSEGGCDRAVSGVAAGGHQNSSDAPNVVPGVEGPPPISQVNLKPGAEVHGAGGNDYSDIAEVSGCVAGWNVQGTAKCDREMLKVSADPDTLGIDTQCGANGTGKLISEGDFLVYPVADRLHPPPPRERSQNNSLAVFEKDPPRNTGCS